MKIETKDKMSQLKLYHLNPDGYGDEWYVMSDSKQNALRVMIDTENAKEHPSHEYLYIMENMHKGISVWGYTLDEYGINEVIKSEIA